MEPTLEIERSSKSYILSAKTDIPGSEIDGVPLTVKTMYPGPYGWGAFSVVMRGEEIVTDVGEAGTTLIHEGRTNNYWLCQEKSNTIERMIRIFPWVAREVLSIDIRQENRVQIEWKIDTLPNIDGYVSLEESDSVENEEGSYMARILLHWGETCLLRLSQVGIRYEETLSHFISGALYQMRDRLQSNRQAIEKFSHEFLPSSIRKRLEELEIEKSKLDEILSCIDSIARKAQRYTHVKWRSHLERYPGFKELFELEDKIGEQRSRLSWEIMRETILFERGIRNQERC